MPEPSELIIAGGTKGCRTCGEQIPDAATKCRHCGSYQNFQRFFDVGQGTIALLVALISVSTLAIDSGLRAYNGIFRNPLVPEISGKVMSVSLSEVELLFINNGSSRVLVNNGALCRLPVVRKGVDLISDNAEMVRFPKREEIEAVYSVVYSEPEAGRFLEASTALRIKIKRHGVLREEAGKSLQEGVVEVKGYCSVGWIGQDAEEGGAFWTISPGDAFRASIELAEFPFEETFNFKAGEKAP